MAVSPARAAAFDILLRVARDSSNASELLHSSAYAKLSTADRALATELTMGVLRWQSLLDHEIASASSQPLAKLDLEVLLSLRLAVYQFSHLQRIPASAAVNDSVSLVKRARKTSAAAFVNAVLRKLSRVDLAPHDLPTPLRFAHPDWLVERWRDAYGDTAASAICEYGQQHPGTSIRVRNISDVHSTAESLKHEAIRCTPGKILSTALRVDDGNPTTLAAKLRSTFAIQDEASQLVAAIAGRATNILDCCAAPGGKTLALLDRNPGASAVAAEIHPHRARLLSKLLANADATSAQVIAADARQLPLHAKFDLVLADVPCSGTGTLARNPEIKWRLRAEDLLDLQTRQRQILAAAMHHVAPGGRLVYSTCSLEREENEDVVEPVLAASNNFRIVDCSTVLDQLRANSELVWNGAPLTSGPYLRTLPGIHPCDGFFACILEC